MPLAAEDRRAASLLARIERTRTSPWHIRALLVMGSATFFDAFDD
jgi:putative MFS transporter